MKNPTGHLVAIAAFASMTFYAPISALYMLSRGLTFEQMFLLETILGGVLLVADIPLGVVGDRIDRKGIVVTGYALALTGSLLFAVAHAFWVFVLDAIASGLSIALLSGTFTAYVMALCTRFGLGRGTRMLGWVNGGENVGMLLAMVVGGWLARTSLATPVYATCVVSAIALIIAAFLPRVTRELVPVDATTGPGPRGTLGEALRYVILGKPWLLVFGCVGPAVWVVVNGLHLLNQPTMLRAGIPVSDFGFVMAGAEAIGLITSVLSDRLESAVGSLRLIVVGNVLIGVGFYALSATRSATLVVGALLLIWAARSARGPVISSLSAQLVPEEIRATGLSIISTAGTALTLILNPVIGHLADTRIESALTVSGDIAVASALLLGGIAVVMGRVRTGSFSVEENQ